MREVKLNEINLEDYFSELDEECMFIEGGGCGCGGTITQGIGFPTKWGQVTW